MRKENKYSVYPILDELKLDHKILDIENSISKVQSSEDSFIKGKI
jgi:hypothetical protein